MIRWFCDMCTTEIGIPIGGGMDNESPQRLAVYTEGIKRTLDGYGEATYHIRLILCENCKRRLLDSFNQKVIDIRQYKAEEK